MQFLYLFSILLLSFGLNAEQFHEIAFADLASEKILSYENQRVRMRGFLYRASDDRLILASQPDLKSCCVGKQKEHVIVEGHLEPQRNAVLVEGIFVIEGNFILKEVHLVESKINWIFWMLIVFSFVVIYMIFKSSFFYR